jgi:6-pyruvoyltetrahydropterin/6-carboxytetrahydropterin synthase
MMYVTKEFTFDSAHKLDWEDGKCKHLHGHTYRLQVTVKGELDSNGVVINFTDLKSIVKNEIINQLDHTDLNKVIENPTAENIVVWVWEKLENKLSLFEIKLWETPTSFVEYRGKL